MTSHFFSSLFSDSRFLINTWHNIAWRKPEQINETTQWRFGVHTGVWEDLNFGCNYEQSACLEDLEVGILFCKQMLQLLCCYTAGMSMSMLYCKTASFFPPYCPKTKHNLSHQPSVPPITQVHLINSAEFFKKWFLSFQMSFSLIDLGETQAQFLANPELKFENWFCKSCWKKKSQKESQAVPGNCHAFVLQHAHYVLPTYALSAFLWYLKYRKQSGWNFFLYSLSPHKYAKI